MTLRQRIAPLYRRYDDWQMRRLQRKWVRAIRRKAKAR